ncbi:zinc finger MYM-type 2-like [Paramuricea clavata]|uniref:Zinc finger MYM-type 2-like n=1 Tax=Paramuricea clavata TaxID=317549 RepID=A0A7D9E1Y3_PARCT|nr:zinc finger MYM-type 2-like [Paramuricea clavata]
MTWGDVKLHKTVSGEEYLEYNERQTKTRSGENTRDVRKVTPKMFSVQGNKRDPIAAYKLFAEKRPAEMNSDDSPFYLAVNNLKKPESVSCKAWFKKAPAGVNKLNSIMKNMAAKAGLTTKFTNHSGRKTMMQALVNQNFPHYSTVGPQEPAECYSLFHCQQVTANGNVENSQFSCHWKAESFV